MLRQRLLRAGMAPEVASSLLADHLPRQITDALDALDTLGPSAVRQPARWVARAVRENWDLGELLAQRRLTRARHDAWEREAQERERADEAYRARAERTDAWSAAISASLTNVDLAAAIDQVTTPVAALERRSAPVARAQILAWAVTIHRRDPSRPLGPALTHDLLRGPTPAEPIGEELPPTPNAAPEGDDLLKRIATVLEERPDLARPRGPGLDQAHPALNLVPQPGPDVTPSPRTLKGSSI